MDSQFEPRNPDWQAQVRASFALQPVCRTLGIELAGLEPGYCEMRMPFRADLTQQHGYFHAGIVTTIADNAGGYAGYTLMPAGSEVLAVEFKVNLMSPAKGDEMIARARVVKSGRTLTVVSVEVVMVENGSEKTCAIMQQTLMCLA